MNIAWNKKSILITGGTGSFGRKFTEIMLKYHNPRRLIIFSRDEFKQHEMAKAFPVTRFPIRYFLGDVRDKARLYRAFEGVDFVVHAAALKQVPALEYNPMEAVKTNILGADNIVDAAIDRGVEKVIALSTDKAVNPVNLYGASKLVAEKIFIAANAYAGGRVQFSVVRYGNVIGSRGSAIQAFLDLREQGARTYPVTDERMTRFWISLEQSVDIVKTAVSLTEGGEIFVPKIPSMKVVDLIRAIEPKSILKNIGIRPGEKIHEILISRDEAYNTRETKTAYVILPQFFETIGNYKKYKRYPMVPKDFEYRSDDNSSWLTAENLKKIINCKTAIR